jgi:phage repressor protein C with HTH and peptisase S24 domain
LSNGFLDKGESVSSDKLEIIGSIFLDLNLDWVITGKGEMFLPKDNNKETDSSVSKYNKRSSNKKKLNVVSTEEIEELSHHAVPVLSLRASAGKPLNFDLPEMIDNYIVLPDIRSDENTFAIEVEGDSMMGTIDDGDLVVGQRIYQKTSMWENYVYMFSTVDGILVKRFLKVDEEGFYHLSSDNPRYPLIKIPEQDIFAIMRVRRKVTTNISGHLVHELREEVKTIKKDYSQLLERKDIQLHEKDVQLYEKDEQLLVKDSQIKEKDEQIRQLQELLKTTISR